MRHLSPLLLMDWPHATSPGCQQRGRRAAAAAAREACSCSLLPSLQPLTSCCSMLGGSSLARARPPLPGPAYCGCLCPAAAAPTPWRASACIPALHTGGQGGGGIWRGLVLLATLHAGEQRGLHCGPGPTANRAHPSHLLVTHPPRASPRLNVTGEGASAAAPHRSHSNTCARTGVASIPSTPGGYRTAWIAGGLAGRSAG